MAENQTTVASPIDEVQDALFDVFSPEPTKHDPLSKVTVTMCHEAMKALYLYKDNPKYKLPGKLIASHPPLGYVVVYIPYVA